MVNLINLRFFLVIAILPMLPPGGGGLASTGIEASSFNGITSMAVARAQLNAYFAGDTELLTANGSQRIDQFQVGDKLLSRSEYDPNGPLKEKEVEEVFVRVAPILNLHIAGHLIRTTGEHPFHVVGQGWIAARFLQIGDILLSHDGQHVPVEGIANSGEVTTVYNLRIADWHTYFVGGQEWGFSVWAHNTYDGKSQKTGDSSGPTSGKPFPESVKAAARAENPTSTCVFCGQPGTATQVDHVTPKSRGGNATIDNAQMACQHCNASKGARDFPVTPPAGYVGPWPSP